MRDVGVTGVQTCALPVSLWTTSVQVVPLSLLIWILSPAASAPLVPDTVSVVSLVMKSPAVPLSVAIAVIASASAGAVVSIVAAWIARVQSSHAYTSIPAFYLKRETCGVGSARRQAASRHRSQ